MSLADRPDNTGMWALTAIQKGLASKTFGLALFLTVGGVFLVVGILDLRETQRLLAEGELARGRVTGRHRSGGRSVNYSLDVEFQTRAGARVRSTEDVGTSRYERTKPGDTVPLRYLPSDPSVMKIGARSELDPRGFIMSLGTFIVAGMFYLFGKRRDTLESVRIAPNDLDGQHPAQAQQHTLPAQPWVARLRPSHKSIMVSAALLGTGLAIAFGAFLPPNAPPRSRHEYFLEGQVLSIALDRKEASIKHGAITGFRPATTMSYNVPDAGQLVELKSGDLITATLVVVRDDIHLDDIKKAAAMPPSLFRTDLDPPDQALTEGWERPSAPPHDLYFVPVGDVPAALMSSLVAGVEQTLGIPVTVLSGVSVERTMFDPARSQLIAEQLIAAVRTGHPTVARDQRARVIAVTAQDMYIKARIQWRFALSLRSNENSAAVVSYARMDPAYVGITRDEELLRSRLRKMIFKNIGMMYYSLPASRDPRSVLYGNVLGLDDLDYMSEFFEPRS